MSIVGAALLCSAVVMLVPDIRGDTLKKYVKLIGALCLICIMLRPAASLGEAVGKLAERGESILAESEAGEDHSKVYSEYLGEIASRSSEEAVLSLLSEQFSVSAEQCRVETEIEQSDGQSRLTNIRIYLFGEAVLRDPYLIESRVGELFGCPCRVY